MHEFHTRPLLSSDQNDLWELLYVALWDAPDEARRPRSVLDHPQIRRLIENWGRPQDFGLAAVENGNPKPVGAIWTRLDHYDLLDDFGCPYPCLGIGVYDAYQGKGIGNMLMADFIKKLPPDIPGLRLGVNPKNKRARALYEKFGFKEYVVGHGGYTQMKRSTNSQ